MKILLRVEREGGGQVVDATTSIIDAVSIGIGRGAGAQIRLHSESLAPIHAVLEVNEKGLLIQDLGSAVGTVVNDQRIQTASLTVGDRVQIGSTELRVFQEDATWGLAVSASDLHKVVDEQQLVKDQILYFDVLNRLPTLLTLSLSVAVALALIYFVLPIGTPDKRAWSSGPLSSVHKFIESDCVKCHTQPFAPVSDKDCLACHTVGDHSQNFHALEKKFPEAKKRCAECHFEHNGKVGVHLRDSRQCTTCHAQIKSIDPQTLLARVGSLSQHPEFKVAVQSDVTENGKMKEGEQPGLSQERASLVKRLALGDSSAVDRTAIKLNHEVHLRKNLRGPNGNVTLQCVDCHSLSDDKKSIKPISFDNNCRSCHILEYEPGKTGEQVAHGSEAKVHEYLFLRYSKILLTAEELSKRPPPKRIKPGQILAPQEINKASLDLINRKIVEAEDTLYPSTCQLCHELEKTDHTAVVSDDYRYKIIKPKIPQHWLPLSRFSHKAHLHKECVDCHKGAAKSTETKDILLPDIASCRECHADSGHLDKVDSDCVMCHPYHKELRTVGGPS